MEQGGTEVLKAKEERVGLIIALGVQMPPHIWEDKTNPLLAMYTKK